MPDNSYHSPSIEKKISCLRCVFTCTFQNDVCNFFHRWDRKAAVNVQKSPQTSARDKDRNQFMEVKGNVKDHLHILAQRHHCYSAWSFSILEITRLFAPGPKLLPLKGTGEVFCCSTWDWDPKSWWRGWAGLLSSLAEWAVPQISSERMCEPQRTAVPCCKCSIQLQYHPHSLGNTWLFREGWGYSTRLWGSAKSPLRLFNTQKLSSPDLNQAHQGSQFSPNTSPRNVTFLTKLNHTWPNIEREKKTFPDHRLQTQMSTRTGNGWNRSGWDLLRHKRWMCALPMKTSALSSQWAF